jgi:hypothetical protein
MTNLTTPIPGQFHGRLGLRTFLDRQQFEKAARCFLGLSRHRNTFAIGETIYFDYDGVGVAADVWSTAPGKGSYWVRGDDGVTYKVSAKMGGWRQVQAVDSRGTALSAYDVQRIRKAVDGEPVACRVHIGGRLHFDGVTRAERDAARAELVDLLERFEAVLTDQ